MNTIPQPKAPQADKIIWIDALDTREDWFDEYVECVESEAGLEYTQDDSQYGMFADEAGNRYIAYVDSANSSDETWCVHLDAE